MDFELIERTATIARLLDEQSPATIDFLEQSDAFELLVSAVLSAQTTDRQVNAVAPTLFSRYPDAFSLATADIEEVMAIIRSTGYYRVKAAHIIGLARMLVEHHDGMVPMEIQELVKLPGVGRKCANVVLGKLGGKPAIIVDTHFGRVVKRLGLTDSTNPNVVEREIAALLPSGQHYRFSMTVNLHGRRVCHARTPDCTSCFLCSLCPSCLATTLSDRTRSAQV
jgi:endonuclease-3